MELTGKAVVENPFSSVSFGPAMPTRLRPNGTGRGCISLDRRFLPGRYSFVRFAVFA
jgi:hypothetical protein